MIVSNGMPSQRYPLTGLFEMDQARALAAQGHDIIFAVVDLRSFRRRRKLGIQHLSERGIEIFSIAIPVGAVNVSIKDKIGIWALSSLYRHIKMEMGAPDIVHAHFLDMAVLASCLCKNEALPLVITEHSSAINSKKILEVNRRRAVKAYSSADRIIAVSRNLQEMIFQRTGFDSVVVPNILNFPSKTIEIDSKFNGRFRFISAGNLIADKGFDILIQAFSLVSKEISNSDLLIMGGGPEEQRLRLLVSNLGLETKVHFFGPYVRPQFAQELATSHVFVLASKHETFGVVFIEAMSMGLPVISTRCGGPEDFVNDSNGLLVDVDDVQALSDAMLKMVKGYKQYNSNDISAYARENFSPETVANTLSCLFKNILNQKREGY